MHWQLRNAASLLVAGLFATNVLGARVAFADTETAAPVVVAPAPGSSVVVVEPAVSTRADWSVFGGRVGKGSHEAYVDLVDGYQNLDSSYRYGLTDGIGLGLAVSWGQQFDSDFNQGAATPYEALAFNPFITLSLLQRPRWDIGITAAPGLRWFFHQCNSGGCANEQKAITLTVKAAALYQVVPRVLMFGVGVDAYSDMTIKNNGVSFSLPVLIGGVVEYHVTDNFALTAEAKGGFWAGSFSSVAQNQVYYITRFALGLAFRGLP